MRLNLALTSNIIFRNILRGKISMYYGRLNNKFVLNSFYFSFQKPINSYNSYAFSTQNQNTFSQPNQNQETQKLIQAFIQKSKKDLQQTLKIHGQNSAQYLKVLTETGFQCGLLNLPDQNHVINKNAVQWLLKAWKIASQNPQLKQDPSIKQTFQLYQYIVGRYFYRMQNLSKAKEWLQLFQLKLQKQILTNFKPEQISNYKFYTYNSLSHIYQVLGDHQKAREYYLKFKQITDSPNIKIGHLHNLFAFRDYAFRSNNKNQAFQAVKHLANIANYKKKQQVEIVYQSCTIFELHGEPFLGIEYLERLHRQIQKIGEDSFIYNAYVVSILYYQQLCGRNKVYDRQQKALKKLINLAKISEAAVVAKQFVFSAYLLKYSQAQMNLNLPNESYQTLKQAYETGKNIKNLPPTYKRQLFEAMRSKVQNTINQKKLEQKFTKILQDITQNMKQAQKKYLNTK